MKAAGKDASKIICHLSAGGLIKPATQNDADAMRAIASGSAVEIKPVKNGRNVAYHRKFWSLINLGFQYWEPEWKLVTDAEQWIAHKVAAAIANYAAVEGIEKITAEIAGVVLEDVAFQRKSRIELETMKTTEAYLSEVMVAAGLFDTVLLPGGGTARARWSISFASCTEERFQQIYKGCSGVIWIMTLQNHFADEGEMQAAVDKLSGYF